MVVEHFLKVVALAWFTWPGFLVPWSLGISLMFCLSLGYLARILGSMVVGHFLNVLPKPGLLGPDSWFHGRWAFS